MLIAATAISIAVIASLNPMLIAVTLLMVSVIAAMAAFNALIVSWIGFIIILTFSSGIITLFVYLSSLSPNENSNGTNKLVILAAGAITMGVPVTSPTAINTSINIFSSQSTLMLIALILITAMLAISIHTYSPNQVITSNF